MPKSALKCPKCGNNMFSLSASTYVLREKRVEGKKWRGSFPIPWRYCRVCNDMYRIIPEHLEGVTPQ